MHRQVALHANNGTVKVFSSDRAAPLVIDELDACLALLSHADLLAAAIEVLAGLNARIDAAMEVGDPLPVFDGVAALHAAIANATDK